MSTTQLTRLAHLHFPSPIPYAHSLRLQEAVLARHFAYRDGLRSRASAPHGKPSSPSPSSSSSSPPPPTLITFSTHPTYTVGRRHLQTNPISAEQQAFLTAYNQHNEGKDKATAAAEFYASPRGGLLTYHAPGQLTAYPVIDLRRHGISARCYVRMLEKTVIQTCKRFGVGNVGTTKDPGVWITGVAKSGSNSDTATAGTATTTSKTDTGKRENSASKDEDKVQESWKSRDRKICAVGVQISRGITSHGIGLNVFDVPIPNPLKSLYTLPVDNGNNDESQLGRVPDTNVESREAEGYLSWGFSRIVACGLQGKSVTWLSRESNSSVEHLESLPDRQWSVSDVAKVFAEEFGKSLTSEGKERVGDVVEISEDEILS